MSDSKKIGRLAPINPLQMKPKRNRQMFDIYHLCEKMDINVFKILLHYAAGDWKALGYDSEVMHSENESGETKLVYTIKPELRLHAAATAAKYLYTPHRALDITANVNVNVEEQQRELDNLKELSNQGMLLINGRKA